MSDTKHLGREIQYGLTNYFATMQIGIWGLAWRTIQDLNEEAYGTPLRFYGLAVGGNRTLY